MTLVPTRKTPAGQEYWDKVSKKTVFYPRGVISENIQTEGMVGQYSVSGKLPEFVKGMDLATTEDFTAIANPLEGMDIEQLRAYAEEKGVDIPGNMKKLETIRQHIIEELNATADAQ